MPTLLQRKVHIGWLIGGILAFLYVPFWFYLLNFPNVFPVYGDGQYYIILAGNLLHHGVFSGNLQAPFAPATFIMPAYPFLVAVFTGVFGSYIAFPFVQMVLAGLTSFLIFKIGEKVFSYRVGVASAVLFLLDPATIFHSLIIMTDVPYVFFLVLAVYLLFFHEESDKPVVTFLAGLAFGAAMLTRVISMFLPILIVPLYFLVKRKRMAAKTILVQILILSIAYGAVVIPWIARNKIVSGVWGIAGESSLNLFQYYVPEFLSYTRGISADQGRDILMADLRREAGIGASEKLDVGSLAYASLEEKIAIGYIRENVFSYAKFHLLKTAPFFLSSQIKNSLIFYNDALGFKVYNTNGGNMTNLLTAGRFKDFLSELLVQPLVTLEEIFWAGVSLLALIGVIFTRQKNRAFVFLFAALILYFAVLTGPMSYSRYRLPASPFLFLLGTAGAVVAAHGAKNLFSRCRSA